MKALDSHESYRQNRRPSTLGRIDRNAHTATKTPESRRCLLRSRPSRLDDGSKQPHTFPALAITRTPHQISTSVDVSPAIAAHDRPIRGTAPEERRCFLLAAEFSQRFNGPAFGTPRG